MGEEVRVVAARDWGVLGGPLLFEEVLVPHFVHGVAHPFGLHLLTIFEYKVSYQTIVMLGRPLLSRFFCSLAKGSKNSINPVSEHVAFGHYFPKEWSEDFIFEQLDSSRKNIREVQLVLNRLGRPSGKVLLKFRTKLLMDKYIDRYNEDFIMTKESAHRVVIMPFELKTQQLAKLGKEKKTKHQVRVKNLDFDISVEELQRLAKDFGEVQHIQMHVRPSGLNNGLATIHFSSAREAEDFSYFCDELLYKERKLRAEVIQVKQQQEKIKFIEEPSVVLESHDFLFKKYMAEEKKSKQVNAKRDDVE